ncbi:hypothetical protein AB0C90_17590 [Streptomyces sp. NPDC048550]|uniref:hypothetical protein n=1 Tax=unclassified Streptomyces TaxID=2593676 RepID=UPI002258B4B9|nr:MULTISPECIES: hypothetical protein [unclassified Streptomyces]MCX5150503.1 hypothetical protein [Streptomyces sp. NBC_00320]WSN47856.1 hypothetical protein OG299_09250 [Streptomyces sp. NBC_01296]WSW62735.1 hypothetical protein OG513_31415 [Streptomyces sp. NBC_00998]
MPVRRSASRARRALTTAAVLTGAVLAAGATTTSAYAAEGQWTIGSGSCVAIEKIELHWTSTGYHDFMANDPIQNSASDPYQCRFTLYDNGNLLWSSSPLPGTGNQSSWYYDGPGHSMQACVDRYYNGTRLTHNCGPLN